MLYYKQICHEIKPTDGWLNSTLQLEPAIWDEVVVDLSRMAHKIL